MNRPFIIIAILLFSFSSVAGQTNSFSPIDRSPMDMIYYPVNYPVLKIQDKITEPLVARVIYSRPQKAGRTVFGGLVKLGDIWRLGANEATEIEFYRTVRIGGKKIAKGRYTLYTIPSETMWTLLINKETDTWGSFKYNPDKNIVQVNTPVQKNETILEYLSMVFEKSSLGCNLIIAWENTRVSLPINF